MFNFDHITKENIKGHSRILIVAGSGSRKNKCIA